MVTELQFLDWLRRFRVSRFSPPRCVRAVRDANVKRSVASAARARLTFLIVGASAERWDSVVLCRCDWLSFFIRIVIICGAVDRIDYKCIVYCKYALKIGICRRIYRVSRTQCDHRKIQRRASIPMKKKTLILSQDK